MATLNKSVGEGNYHCISHLEEDDFSVEDFSYPDEEDDGTEDTDFTEVKK